MMKILPSLFAGTLVWRCDYQMGVSTEPIEPVRRIIIHNTFKHTTPEALLDYHRSLGWAGIGYHFAIAPQGRVYATRPVSLKGSHAYGRNGDSIGIVLFDSNVCADSPRAIKSFHRLRRALTRQYGELLLQSHSHAQLDYFCERLKILGEEHTATAILDGLDPLTPEGNALLKERARSLLHRSHEPERESLSHLVENLKVCPGPAYGRFIVEDV